MTTSDLFDAGITMDVDGVATHYYDTIDGPPLLLLHGSGPGVEGLFTWAPVLPQLTRHFRVIVVDAPGYGRSDMLDVPDKPANVAQHLWKLLDRLRVQQVSLVGHSRGGRIVCEMSLAQPARVRRLGIICAASVAPNGHSDENGEWTQPSLALTRFGFDGDTSLEKFKSTLRTLVYRPENVSDEDLEWAYERFAATRLEEYVAKMRAFDPLAFYHHEDEESFNARLKDLTVPTTIIWGHEDRVSPFRHAVDLLDLLPAAELHLLPRFNHWAPRDIPVELCELLYDFFTRDEQLRG